MELLQNITNSQLASLVTDLTATTDLTSIPTTMTVPYSHITSVLAHYESYQSSAVNAIGTVHAEASTISLINDLIQAQATLNYYSVLERIATATATSSADLAQAAQASHAMKKIFDNNAFYSGNYPSLGGNIALLVVYSIMLFCQVVFGIWSHQWWFFVSWTCGLLLEVLGYCGRVWSHINIMNFNAFVLQLVCLTLAPCFMMAGIYYIIAQLTLIYGQKFSPLRPMSYSAIFITCDIISIALQAAGGGIAAGALSLFNSTRPGANVMVGGLAFQVFTIGVFQFFWYVFLWRIWNAHKAEGDAAFNPHFAHVRARRMLKYFLAAVSVAVLLVFIRSVYRLIELAEGWSSDLAVDEIYFMILEALMISAASCLMTVFHPGFAYGRGAHLKIDKSPKALFSKKKEDEHNYAQHDDQDNVDDPLNGSSDLELQESNSEKEPEAPAEKKSKRRPSFGWLPLKRNKRSLI